MRASHPYYLHKMLHLPELRISCYHRCPVLDSRGEREAVRIGDAVLGLVFRGLKDKAVQNRKDRETQALNVSEHLDLLLVPELPLCRVYDLSKIYGIRS